MVPNLSRKRIFSPKDIYVPPNKIAKAPILDPQLEATPIIVKCSENVVKQGRKHLPTNVLDDFNISDLGYVPGDFKSVGEQVDVSLLAKKEIVQLMLNPKKWGRRKANVVRVQEDGTVIPAFIPDISDLAMFPKPLKLVVKWILRESEGVVPNEVKQLWNSQAPVLPSLRHGCIVDRGSSFWYCYNDAPKLQLFNIMNAGQKSVALHMSYSKVSKSTDDGRKYRCCLIANPTASGKLVIYKKERYSPIILEQTTILVWNCLGVGRLSFMRNLLHLLKQHTPNILVLLETRCSYGLLKETLAEIRPYNVEAQSPELGFGGMAIVSLTESAHFTFDDWVNKKNVLSGILTGKKVT